ncbi:hypothetical protein BH09PSE2_BH09PSE2_22680 [soil metagenome]
MPVRWSSLFYDTGRLRERAELKAVGVSSRLAELLWRLKDRPELSPEADFSTLKPMLLRDTNCGGKPLREVREILARSRPAPPPTSVAVPAELARSVQTWAFEHGLSADAAVLRLIEKSLVAESKNTPITPTPEPSIKSGAA